MGDPDLPDKGLRRDLAKASEAKWWGVSLLTVLILLFVWWLLTSGLKLVKPLYFPSPAAVWATFWQMHQRIWVHALATLVRVIVSWFIGSFLGIVVGLLMVRSRLMESALSPDYRGASSRPAGGLDTAGYHLVWDW